MPTGVRRSRSITTESRLAGACIVWSKALLHELWSCPLWLRPLASSGLPVTLRADHHSSPSRFQAANEPNFFAELTIAV